ncbi:MAG TPA: hypothetical protein DCR67_01605 [Brevibacillus sp.]|nr:hypothetical protein [Brevibacillus sp.]
MPDQACKPTPGTKTKAGYKTAPLEKGKELPPTLLQKTPERPVSVVQKPISADQQYKQLLLKHDGGTPI